MKKSAIVILCLLCNANTFAQKNDTLLVFNKKIEWSSFKGTPDNDTLGARISTSIHLGIAKTNIWNGTILFKAYASMNPLKSWVKKGYSDQFTLQHEQTHFNITEIYARHLQTELNQLKIKDSKSSIIQTALTKWQQAMEELQEQYDKETKGGNNRAAQNVWNDKILTELNTTD